MHRYIALIRGVTPTGKGRVPMADLRQALVSNGFPDARTWIQSGNIVLSSALEAAACGEAIHRLIREKIGPDLPVIVKTPAQVRAVLDGNPFDGLLPERVFYAQWQGEADMAAAEKLQQLDFGEERLVITPEAAYMYIPGSAARSKLNNNFLERKLGLAITTRNRNTLSKLVEMAEE